VFAVFAGALGSGGLSPQPTPGGYVGLGFHYRAFALFAEGRIDAGATLQALGGVVHTNVMLGSLLPCFQWNQFGACAVLSVGAIQVEGHLAFGRRETTPIVKAGARLQYEWMPFRHLGLQVHAEVSGVPTRVTVYADAVPLWSTSPATGELGLGIIALF